MELCKVGFECRNGKCVDKCTGVVCSGNQICVDGKCVPFDKCAAVTCPVGWTCKNGVCIEPPC